MNSDGVSDAVTVPPATIDHVDCGNAQTVPADAAPVPTPAAPPGYEIIEELGRGGMGLVYKARHQGLNRIVALKMILSGGHASGADLARFHAEAEAIARLRHPNIVQVYDVGEQNGLPYFSLEFCPGGSLDRKLKGMPMSQRESAELVAKLARAIQEAHHKGILHRDLKPANVLLGDDGVPKITDFGLAKTLDGPPGQTASGAVLGTPSYMAPEQAAGKTKEIGPAVDIYALGATLYELLTGRPPFRAATPLDTLLQAISNDPAPVRLLNPEVDRDLETICMKCLEKDTTHRFASAEALALDLERYLAGEPISVRSINMLERLTRTLQRSQYDVQFHAYGTVLFGFAAVVLVTEAVLNICVIRGQSIEWIPLIQAARIALFGLVFWLWRPPGVTPGTVANRLMWSVWLGYIVGSFVMSIAYRSAHGWNTEIELNLYPLLAVLAGMAFSVMGSSYWGWCYAFAGAFFALALIMNADLRFAPIEFGTLWAIALVTIGIHLRTRARDE